MRKNRDTSGASMGTVKEPAINHTGIPGSKIMAKKAFSLVSEFKSFAFKGNVIDMAVGVIIGAAFGKIIDSLVKQIIMPCVSVLLPSNQSYLGWKIVVGAKEIPYGLFIGEVVNFLIVAVVLFVFIVKFLGFLTKAKQAESVALPSLTMDQQLLIDIRDLLKAKNKDDSGKV